jgi:hypothetical protein
MRPSYFYVLLLFSSLTSIEKQSSEKINIILAVKELKGDSRQIT